MQNADEGRDHPAIAQRPYYNDVSAGNEPEAEIGDHRGIHYFPSSVVCRERQKTL
jgi:hypothetical protein